MAKIKYVGLVIGNIRVLEDAWYYTFPSWKRCKLFKIVCTCGKEKIKHLSAVYQWLKTGKLSCWCIWKEEQRKKVTKHWMKYTSEYNIWRSMKDRCYSKKIRNYRFYWNKWITVCDGWKDSFEQFYKDMWPRPSKEHSIDRINTNWNYDPWNCRWATRFEQLRNKSNNNYITYKWKTLVINDWGKIMGINGSTIFGRLKSWWTLKQAMNKPVRKRK